MQDFLLSELERLASRPQIEQLLAQIRERNASQATRISPEEILAHRDADRR